MLSHLRSSFRAMFSIELSLIMQIGESLNPSNHSGRDEGECLQCFNCDALVAIARYWLTLLFIHWFIHSFTKHLLST